MKLIAVDVGNTSTAVGLWSGGRVSRVLHVDGDRAAAFAAAEELLALGADGIAYVSVVPRADAAWRRFAKSHGVPFVRVDHELFGAASGLSLDYPHPETIGADRLADAAAAVDRYGAPVIVISMRTATTLVVTDKSGAFRGGVILPGVKLGYGALAAGTSLLPEIAVLPAKKVIGANTVDAMCAGAFYGTAAMIDGLLEHMEAELKYPCTAVATGGLAREVIPFCRRRDIVIDPDLMLKGLWILYRKNR